MLLRVGGKGVEMWWDDVSVCESVLGGASLYVRESKIERMWKEVERWRGCEWVARGSTRTNTRQNKV